MLASLLPTLPTLNARIPTGLTVHKFLEDECSCGVIRPQVRFVTNTTKETAAKLVQTVQSAGLNIQEPEVFSSLRAAQQLTRQRQLRPLLLLHPDALPEFADVDCSNPNAVVLGLAKDAFSYESMNTAFRLLIQQPEAALIAIHKAKYYKASDGQLALGPGPYATALEFATGRTAMVVGKPEASFFQLALDDMGATPQQAVMVGDDVCDDVGGAMACGMAGILVQTGKYLPGDETSKGVTPTATVQDFAAAVEWILQTSSPQ
eukprot:GHUV01027904.1.p1 GENE.GHUV01027904.1~~GHUV01027904.1.p1  ORF type:complete len:262 (+),score=77.67 GHUV01027904.1:254-1039(+)